MPQINCLKSAVTTLKFYQMETKSRAIILANPQLVFCFTFLLHTYLGIVLQFFVCDTISHMKITGIMFLLGLGVLSSITRQYNRALLLHKY